MSWGAILTKSQIEKVRTEEKHKEKLEFLRQKILKDPKNFHLKSEYLKAQGLDEPTVVSIKNKIEKIRASRFPLDLALELLKEGKKVKEIAELIGFSVDFTFKKLRKYRKKGE